jgi:hypothetical protein
MTTTVLPLSGESLNTMRSLAHSAFLDGECYAFAIAVSRGTGFPIVGLMEGSVPRHALVYNRDKGAFLDVRGEHTLHDQRLGEPFGHRAPYDLKEIPEARLFGQRPVHDMTIASARRMAEALFPALPWKRGRAARAREFCDELEALCRRHGFWIRSPYPAAKPILCEAHQDEAGYTLRPTDCGMHYTIDRRLNGESMQ